jgi:hypothetical protein
MLPFDNRPWARTVAGTVIGLSVVAAVAGAYYLYTLDQLHIPEVTGIILLLLTILPPNIAILYRGQRSRNEAGITPPASGTTKVLSEKLVP